MLAILHRGNLSNGVMFDDVMLTTKKLLDKSDAIARMKWEPLYEVNQVKGDAETDPALSPNDKFANFERWNRGSFGPDVKTPARLPTPALAQTVAIGIASSIVTGRKQPCAAALPSLSP